MGSFPIASVHWLCTPAIAHLRDVCASEPEGYTGSIVYIFVNYTSAYGSVTCCWDWTGVMGRERCNMLR